MTERETCKACKFWDQWESTLKMGYCLRSSPEISPGSSDARWPVSQEFHWCGEHKPIKAEKPEGMSGHTWHESLREQGAIQAILSAQEKITPLPGQYPSKPPQ